MACEFDVDGGLEIGGKFGLARSILAMGVPTFVCSSCVIVNPSLARSAEERVLPDDEIRVRSGDQTLTQILSRLVERKVKWPKILLSTGPGTSMSKQSEPASSDDTISGTLDEIRDNNENLLNRLAPLFTEHVLNAVLPVIAPTVAALQEEQKRQDTSLELEARHLALKMYVNARCVGRSQRRRRTSSAKPLRPRTRQLGHRLKFPWKN